jgi:hypothetical protein
MKTTMELCKEAGFPLLSFEGVTYVSPELERLVALVRADEREETNCRANASWTLMCEKMVAIERERVLKILDDQGTWAHVGDLIELVKGNT